MRLFGLVALALGLLSSACTYRTQAPAQSAQLDYSEALAYDQPFGVSPTRAATQSPTNQDFAAVREESEGHASRGNALGFAETPRADREQVAEKVSESAYTEVEATPGTACYEAALKSGISKGTCTLVTERTYLLVGEKGE
ncbi:MAG: hypothetical protein IPK82_10555 [Polyangiaceae bacterium]|nr:hypothetical protein [Polyangiaceae bacterium]